MVGKPVIAAFDFDKTLLTQDTLPDFMRHSCSPLPLVRKTLSVLPTLLRFAAGRINNTQAKEALLTTFLGGMPDESFAALCEKYAARLDKLANRLALERVAWHKARGDEIIIVSASPEDWIQPWATMHGIKTVIATRLEHHNGQLTGHLDGPNCHGPEKLVRFLEVYPKRATYELYMYGDGKSDAAMFEAADHAFKRRFA